MTVYKITPKNIPLPEEKLASLYFEEQKTAEAVIAAFDFLAGEKGKVEWECEAIDVKSHEDAFNELMQLGKDVLPE